MLKRYWKSLFTVIIIFFTIGAFYVQAQFEQQPSPDFKLKTIAGDSKELEKLKIYAHYSEGERQQRLILSKDGSTYRTMPSYFGLLKNYFAINEIQRRNRQFMRGKKEFYNIFENEQWIAYATIPLESLFFISPDNRLIEIDVLNKNTRERNTFDFVIPFEHQLGLYSISNVNIMNDQLFVLTGNNNEEGITNLILYEFDIQNEQLTGWINFNDLFGNDIDSSDAIYRLGYINTNEERLFFRETINNHGRISDIIVSYNLLTGETEEVNIAEEISEDNEAMLGVDNVLYFHEPHEEQVNIVKYDYLNDQFTTFSFKPEGIQEKGFSIQIYGDKLYMYNLWKTLDEKAFLMIGSLTTGEVLYSGEIVTEDSINENSRFELSIIPVMR